MAATERFLSIDIGAGNIRMAEFEYANGNMILQAFDWRRIDSSESGASRVQIVSDAIKDMTIENNFTVKKAHVCTSGQAALIKFVKLPPITGDESKIHRTVQFEAEQNIPFPLDEVSWDYQLISSADDEIDVMLVVIKNDIVNEITESVATAGVATKLIDISSAALLNAARASNIGTDECVMLLDIGERCSDLIFIDGNRFFTRSINIAGQTITQQIAKEFKIGIKEAEEIKRKHGFVALGAGYEDPESEFAAVVSKIIRNVMTRLHSDINRSKNIYVSQQKGNKPVRLYLTGGSSLMNYTDTFFAEKLGIETLYFNPFEIVRLAPKIQPERLQPIAHTFAAVVGTALRVRGESPVEISLMPDFMKEAQEFKPKKKFLFASMLLTICMLSIIMIVGNVKKTRLQDVIDDGEKAIGQLEKVAKQIDEANDKVSRMMTKYDVISKLSSKRGTWSKIINMMQTLIPEDMTVTEVTPFFAEAEKSDEEEENSRSSKFRRPGKSVAVEEENPIYSQEEIIGLNIKGYTVTKKNDSREHEVELTEALRSSVMFDSNPKATEIVSSLPVKEFPNVRTFEEKATFAKAISLIKE